MPGNLLQGFGTQGQTITITLASLANGSARASTAIDNTSNLFQNILPYFRIKTGATGVSSTGFISVYVSGTVNNGTNYLEGATGSDAAITLASPTNLKWIGNISANANATTGQFWSGILPAGPPITFSVPLSNGLTWQVSGALTAGSPIILLAN